MLTYGKKKRSILPTFSAFRGFGRSANSSGSQLLRDSRSVSCTVLPHPSGHSARVSLHNDSIDDLASQILSEDTTFNMPAAPSIYRNPRYSLTMPQLPSLQSNVEDPLASRTNPLSNAPAPSSDSQYIDDSTDPLNHSSTNIGMDRDHTPETESPPIIPRKSSKRKSKKQKSAFRRLISGGSGSGSAPRPSISSPTLIDTTSTLVQDGLLIDIPTRPHDRNPDQIFANTTSATTASNSRRDASTGSSSIEISGRIPSSSSSITTTDNIWRADSTASSPLISRLPSNTTPDNGPGGASRRSDVRQISDPINGRHISGSTNARHISGSINGRNISVPINPRRRSGAIDVRTISAPTNPRHLAGGIDVRPITGGIIVRSLSGYASPMHIPGPFHSSSTTASTAVNNGGGLQPTPSSMGGDRPQASTAVNNGGGLQPTPNSMGGYRPQLVLARSTGNIGLDLEAKIAAMQAHTAALKGAPPPEIPKPALSKNMLQKAKAVMGSFGKKRATVQSPVDSNQKDPGCIDENDSLYIDPDILWKQDDISWEDADSQLPKMDKILNEAQSLSNPKVAARCGRSIPRKRVANDGRSIRTKQSFYTEQQSSSDPFSDDQQLREFSHDQNSSGFVSNNHIAITRDDNGHEAFTNADISMTRSDNSLRSVNVNDISTAHDSNSSGNVANQFTTSPLILEEVPRLPTLARYLRDEFPSRHNRVQANMDDMLSSSPVAQSTPRIGPSFERSGTARLWNISSSLGDDTDMDLDSSSPHVLPNSGLNNHGKRESSPVQEQSSLGIEPQAPVIPNRMRAKKPRNNYMASTFVNHSMSSTSASSNNHSDNSNAQRYGDSMDMRTISSTGRTGDGNRYISNSVTQGFCPTVRNHTMNSSSTSRGGNGIGRSMSSYDMIDNDTNRGNSYPLSTDAPGFGRSVSNIHMSTTAEFRSNQSAYHPGRRVFIYADRFAEYGSGLSASEHSESIPSNSRRFGGVLYRTDTNAMMSNSPFPAVASGPSSRDRTMAASSNDELSEQAEDRDISRGFGTLHLDQATSVSSDTSHRRKKPTATTQAGECTSSSRNTLSVASRAEVGQASRRDVGSSMMEIDELQMDQTALMK